MSPVPLMVYGLMTLGLLLAESMPIMMGTFIGMKALMRPAQNIVSPVTGCTIT